MSSPAAIERHKHTHKHREPDHDPSSLENKGKTTRKSKKVKADLSATSSKPDEDTTLDIEQTAMEGTGKMRSKRKHAASEEALEAVSNVQEPEKKKKKRKHEGNGDNSEKEKPSSREDVDVNITLRTSERKKRKKHSKKDAEIREGVRGAKIDEEVGSVDGAAPLHPSVTNDKKDKKKRRKGLDDQHAEGVEEIGDPASSSMKHKRSKHRSSCEYPDPEKDDSLSDQARKALHYAFSQFDNRSIWKFNKARQNWILRNIWSKETVPEIHVPLVLRYLKNVQGGVREKLVTSCREILETGEIDGASAGPLETDCAPDERTVKFTIESTEIKNTPPDDTKQQRASALLQVLASDIS